MFSNLVKHFDVEVDVFPTSIYPFCVSEVLASTSFSLKAHDA